MTERTCLRIFEITLSSLVAIVGLVSGVYFGTIERKSNIELKKYEVTFIKKRESYSNYMRALSDLYFLALNRDGEPFDLERDFNRGMAGLESETYFIEPFFSSCETVQEVRRQKDEFIVFCRTLKSRQDSEGNQGKQGYDEFLTYETRFRDLFYQKLFKDTASFVASQK